MPRARRPDPAAPVPVSPSLPKCKLRSTWGLAPRERGSVATGARKRSGCDPDASGSACGTVALWIGDGGSRVICAGHSPWRRRWRRWSYQCRSPWLPRATSTLRSVPVARHTLNFGGTDRASHVAITPDGRIVTVGSTDAIGGGDYAVARFGSDGAPDGSFGSGGKVTLGTQPGVNDIGGGWSCWQMSRSSSRVRATPARTS